ncbi:ATP-binding cassette domain-containing protein [Lactobacillus sp. DCY120]|uniref:ATP-binding cassette domain-containing protein n=1 Tax=Bombilactobacillus apium TaxID=2675299 RepID=A0A850R7T7_9LACO|nr:ATP-binding cassette domain-containing protein [Bombilactobacillus apium]NVY96595.1 ATP-binding cassette domain-containing protein [Bombilactobacillus apium]
MKIKISNLSFSYDQTPVFSNLDFNFSDGRIFALFGPNGRGKTTLLRLLNGDLEPGRGNFINIPKSRMFILGSDIPFNYLSGLEFIEYILFLKKIECQQQLIFSVADELGLSHHQLQQYVDTYSEGMKYKTLMVCVYLAKPKLLLLDEPFTALDLQTNMQLSKLLGSSSIGTIIFSTHTAELAIQYSEQILYLESNRIISARTSQFESPHMLERYLRDLMLENKEM